MVAEFKNEAVLDFSDEKYQKKQLEALNIMISFKIISQQTNCQCI